MDIVEQMRGFECDHEPDGWPAIQMKQVSALCDEIERLQGLIDAANAQEPYGWDSAGDLIFSIDDGVNGVMPVPLYAAPVPAQQSPDVAVHDEWKYVPIEPTQEMKAAGENAISYKTSAHMIWNEMLAAGPSRSQHRCAQSPRITEQDAREIATAWVKHLDDHDETVAIPDFEWSHHEWKLILRTLLNKLNGDENGK